MDMGTGSTAGMTANGRHPDQRCDPDRAGQPARPGAAPSPTQHALRAVALVVLAAAFTVALTFASLELPHRLAGLARDWLAIPDLHPAIEPAAIDAFIADHNLQVVAWACLAAIAVLVVAGIALGHHGAAAAGAVALFLPTFGSFASAMFFLVGLGALRVLWLPAWGTGIMALGDVAFVPYVALTLPPWLAGFDARLAIGGAAIALGLLIFTLAVASWLMARAEGRGVVEGWLYRHSRHPQYLGWIVWSWGMMVVASIEPVPMAGENPGGALGWTLSTLVIVAVAWAEERRMAERHPGTYPAYRGRTPFLFPVPRVVAVVVSAPLQLAIGRDHPERLREIAIGVAVYAAIVALLSLPFAVLDWPPMDWWGWPGFAPGL
jgi:protein-S-isoprenylcysteine O-methyltransferase Ste14